MCETGSVIEMNTTKLGMQFYSGNLQNISIAGKDNKTCGHRYEFCLILC